MTISSQDGPIIFAGYPWALRVTTEAAKFPVGATFRAQVRVKPSSTSALAEMTTANSGVARVDDYNADLVLTDIQTAAFPTTGSVWIDLVRTDQSPSRHLGFLLEVPVALPVTRV